MNIVGNIIKKTISIGRWFPSVILIVSRFVFRTISSRFIDSLYESLSVIIKFLSRFSLSLSTQITQFYCVTKLGILPPGIMKNILVYRSRYQPRYNRKIWVAMFQKHLFRKTWIIKRNPDEIHFFFFFIERLVTHWNLLECMTSIERKKKKRKKINSQRFTSKIHIDRVVTSFH